MAAKGKFVHGHITSISVLRDYRYLGIATKLMRACHHAMKTVYRAKFCSLHVRVTNRAAFTLYKEVLGYEICSVANEYYADKEDAYDMKLFFDSSVRAVVLKDKTIAKLEEEKTEPTSLAEKSNYAQAEDGEADSTAASQNTDG